MLNGPGLKSSGLYISVSQDRPDRGHYNISIKHTSLLQYFSTYKATNSAHFLLFYLRLTLCDLNQQKIDLDVSLILLFIFVSDSPKTAYGVLIFKIFKNSKILRNGGELLLCPKSEKFSDECNGVSFQVPPFTYNEKSRKHRRKNGKALQIWQNNFPTSCHSSMVAWWLAISGGPGFKSRQGR